MVSFKTALIASTSFALVTLLTGKAYAGDEPGYDSATSSEEPTTTYTLTLASASHFPKFDFPIDAPSVAWDMTEAVNDQLSWNFWVRVASEGDSLHPVGTEVDITATYTPVKNNFFSVSFTGGGYYFPADDIAETAIATGQLAVDITPTENLSFHFEHGEYVGGLTEGQSEASGTITLPLRDGAELDFTGGISHLREADDDIVFMEAGYGRDGWRLWVEYFDGEFSDGFRAALTWTWQ